MSEAEFKQSALSAFDVPRHVAIIMDGNGRWAAARGLPRVEGHRRGVEALRRTIRAAGEIGIKIVTIFSFSAENWSRPANVDQHAPAWFDDGQRRPRDAVILHEDTSTPGKASARPPIPSSAAVV